MLASTHRSDARVRNLAWRGSRSREPRQRLCIGAPHIVVMAGKPTRAPPGRARVTLTVDAPRALRPRHRSVLATGDSRIVRLALEPAPYRVCVATWPAVRQHRLLGGGPPAAGWSAQYGDAANSSYSAVAGADGAAPGVDPVGQGRARRPGGPRLGQLSGRQRPDRGRLLADGVGDRQQRPAALVHPAGARAAASSSPLFDGFDNLYVGQPGAMHVLPVDPVDPVAPSGDRHADDRPAARPRPAAGGDAPGPGAGVRRAPRHRRSARRWTWSAASTRRTPSAASPTVSRPGRVPGGRRAGVLRRRPGSWCSRCGSPARRRADARRPALPAGTDSAADPRVDQRRRRRRSAGQPGAVRRRRTVYVNGRDERLWALDTDDGTAKWSVPLDYLAQTPPSVSPDGLIIAGGGPDAKLVAVRDTGDHGEVVWTRDDVAPLSTSSLAGARLAYTVTRDGDDGLALLVFDPADGAHASTAIRCPTRPGGRWGCRSATTAAWSPRPATARSTASRPTEAQRHRRDCRARNRGLQRRRPPRPSAHPGRRRR